MSLLNFDRLRIAAIAFILFTCALFAGSYQAFAETPAEMERENSERDALLQPAPDDDAALEKPKSDGDEVESAEAAASDADAESAKASRGFLWRLQSKTTTVYLLGSIHVADKSLYPLSDAILSAFEESEVLALEIDMDDVRPAAMRKLVAEHGVYKDGRTLKQVLPADLHADLAAEFKKLGMDFRLVQAMKPWLIQMTVSQLRLQKFGYEQQYGIDFYFHKAAKSESNKTIEGLETAEGQLRMLADRPEAEQIEFLRRTLYEGEDAQYMRPMLRAWREGDEEYIETKVLSDLRDDPKLRGAYKAIFTDRNIEMAKRVRTYLAGERVCFVVVGAGHLIGPDGMIALLASKDYTIERL
ncbi:MAG: TraB/GumN family protein [bacterium]|nr:TraB/GumN family protein [bacterium]